MYTCQICGLPLVDGQALAMRNTDFVHQECAEKKADSSLFQAVESMHRENVSRLGGSFWQVRVWMTEMEVMDDYQVSQKLIKDLCGSRKGWKRSELLCALAKIPGVSAVEVLDPGGQGAVGYLV